MKQMSLIEMDGFLKGKCIPSDLKVNETNAEYLVRKFAEAEAKFAALAAENAWLKSETPLGAIENGRAFADRLENYQFECKGGNLNMCSDWQEFRRCFEYLSEWAMHSQTEHPATDAFMAEVRAQGVEMFGQYHNFSEKLFIQKEAQKFAAQLRKGGNQ
ncbi:TPA: hypothetical protein JLU44_000497 [Escherichia coli]|nr:hypothetical protein [Escherichia coli]HAV9665115.1 hypothetical protein [Escherichia coli]HAW0083506.1 hypothetical protein [Escherichia coli]HAW0391347.1 hypothetical protein [Escherichia coli]HAW1174200.1 hypothetical protein [Escherichia coli]